jgi:hypothetical protein
MSARDFNTPEREPWNAFIKAALKAIDTHNTMYFQTQNPWHLQKASELRAHVKELKEWITLKEN